MRAEFTKVEPDELHRLQTTSTGRVNIRRLPGCEGVVLRSIPEDQHASGGDLHAAPASLIHDDLLTLMYRPLEHLLNVKGDLDISPP